MKKKLKIVAISDLHGYLPNIKEGADIAIIAGDIVPLRIQFDKPASKVWFETHFADWVIKLPVETVFMVAGNHDSYFENLSNTEKFSFISVCDRKVVYLENETATYTDCDGFQWTIFGTPYCHLFGNWPFMHEDDYMINKFKAIPSKVDIIISHDPPFGISDADVMLEPSRYRNFTEFTHLGNVPLGERLKTVDYKILFCGHIHGGDHTINTESKVVNVSYLNEEYKVGYNPLYIEIEHD